MGKRGPQRIPIERRFWSLVQRGAVDDCWLWTGHRDPKGYGQIAAGGYRGGHLPAHRVSWELAYGPVPLGDGYHGACVLHRCDNPSCVNPQHLFLGSHLDNMLDMKRKGRAAGGPGPITVDLPFVNSYVSQHGTPRYYFRRNGIRIKLPGLPGSPEFEEAYQCAISDGEHSSNLTHLNSAVTHRGPKTLVRPRGVEPLLQE